MTTTLLEIPDVPMTEVMSYLDYLSIQNTRKTCSTLRNFIDKSQLDPCLRSIKFIAGADDVQVFMVSGKDTRYVKAGEKIHLFYQKTQDGSKIKWFPKKKTKDTHMKNENVFDVFWRDWEGLLINEKTSFEEICILNGLNPEEKTFANKFEEVMKLRKQPLSSKGVTIAAANQNDVVQILQCFDSNYLKSIELPHSSDFFEMMDVSEMGKLDQWKQVKSMELHQWFFPAEQIQSFAHFSSCNFLSTNIDAEKIRNVKEIFLDTKDFKKKFSLQTDQKMKDSMLLEALGRQVRLPTHSKLFIKLFFKTKNSLDKVLCIVMNQHHIDYLFVERSKVPSNTVIIE